MILQYITFKNHINFTYGSFCLVRKKEIEITKKKEAGKYENNIHTVGGE